jgi:hypothetical protein
VRRVAEQPRLFAPAAVADLGRLDSYAAYLDGRVQIICSAAERAGSAAGAGDTPLRIGDRFVGHLDPERDGSPQRSLSFRS